MSISLIIFIGIHIVVLSYVFELLRRLRRKVREYPLEDTRETIPFGLIRLRHVVIIYIISYGLWVICSLLLYAYFVGGISFGFQASPNVLNL